ncbi:MAG: glycosyltransferase [Candidatus Aminicenantes bacterium]|nr:glycosyltransferase [Candidatus Aminicenantes bacterium]
MNVIHFSRFVPVTHLGGGARRTLQVVELLKFFSPQTISTARAGGIQDAEPRELGKYFENIELKRFFNDAGELKYWSTFDVGRTQPTNDAGQNKKAYRSSKAPLLPRSGSLAGCAAPPPEAKKYWSNNHRKMAERLHAVAEEWAETLDFSQLGLAFVDDPIYFQPLLRKLKKEGIPVVAISHNIESLAAHQVEPRYRKNLFSAELAVLAACDLVISISREETWLFRNFGIDALFLPYYPPEQILARMLRVRQRRETSKKKDFLLIGSAVNAATRQGILDVVALWREKKLRRKGDRLLVAGYMSDVFLQELKAGADSADFLGPLSDEELDEIMTRVKAGIVYQKSGSGALTRIAEMLTAAVPVLANSHAVRSYFDMEGVVEFRDLIGMGDFFAEIERLDGWVPLPPQPDSSYLIAEIKKLVCS